MSDRMPSLESLRVFEASARHGNLSRAAEELGVTAAAVSLRVRRLEEELGSELFDRNGPRIKANDKGRALAERISEGMVMFRDAVQIARNEGDRLRITCTPTFAARWLMPRLPNYLAIENAPPVELDLAADVRNAAKFDIAIRSGRGGWSGFAEARLMPIRLTPMLSPRLARQSRVIEPADLMRLPLVPDPAWPDWFQVAGVPGRPPNFLPAAYDILDMAATAALGGIGAALLSVELFSTFVESGELLAPFEAVLETGLGYHLLTHAADARSGVEAFASWIFSELSRGA